MSSHQCHTNTRMTKVIAVRHTGQPAASSATEPPCLVQDSQKRACPHGTRANPCRGSTRHTSQQSSGAAVAAAADEVGADDAGRVASPALSQVDESASSSESPLSARSCSESVCAPTE